MAYTTIDDPSEYFNTKIFTGDNSANNAVTGVGFQPDWIWFKNRDAANDHAIVDSVRGRKALSSNNINEELTLNANKDFQSFDSDGFTVDAVEQLNSFNKSGDSLVSWNWKKTADAGFDIVAFTGNGSARTISHSLSAVPKMYIVKNRSTADYQWRVYHASLGATKHMALDATQAVGDAASVFNDTEPTSSVFSVGTDEAANKNGDSLIAYLFAEKQGYSKFGSYTGNGNANGTFSYTGFKVGWVMIKRTDTGNSWLILDNKRIGFNPDNNYLLADTSDADGADNFVDLYSNGFKIMSADAAFNANGGTYIYMAFAEQPFVTSKGVPATAR